jgi:hypothetical protein
MSTAGRVRTILFVALATALSASVSLAQEPALAPALEVLLADHGAAVALHRRAVGSDQLRRHHAFEFVFGRDTHQGRDGRTQLFVAILRARCLLQRICCGATGGKDYIGAAKLGA